MGYSTKKWVILFLDLSVCFRIGLCYYFCRLVTHCLCEVFVVFFEFIRYTVIVYLLYNYLCYNVYQIIY